MPCHLGPLIRCVDHACCVIVDSIDAYTTMQVKELLQGWMEEGVGHGTLRVWHEHLPLTCAFNLAGLRGGVVRHWEVGGGKTTTTVAGAL